MPQIVRTDTHTGITAEHERKLRRHAVPSAHFDPNETPVIIGAGASAGGGSTPDDLSGGATDATAVGPSAKADGDKGVAIGYSFAHGDWAIGIGYGASPGFNSPFGGTPGTDNIAIGRNSKAGNDSGASFSVAIGNGSHANTDSGTALGVDAGAIGVSAVALGANAAAGKDVGDPADYSVAVGSASAYGTESIAIGRLSQTTLTATGGVAVGKDTYANGVNSTALGCGARAGDHELVLGTDTENVIMPGAVAMPGLPTADPLVSGAVWNDGGILTVSP